MGDDNDTVTSTVGAAITGTIRGGAGTDTLILAAGDNISGATVSQFEAATVTGATLSPTQYNSLGTITNTGTATMSTNGTVTGAIGTIALAAGANTVTAALAAATTISGNTGNDAITVTGALATLTYAEGAPGGTDTLTLAADNGGAITIPGLIEAFNVTTAQTSGTITNGAQVTAIDTSSISTAITLNTTNAAATSTKFGAGNDTVTALAAGTAAHTLSLGAGVDTITALTTGAGALTVDFGTGNGVITDVAAVGAGVLTLKFGTPASGTTDAISVAATTANFAVGTIFDFAADVTGVITGQANGTLGVAGGNGQVFVDSVTNAANTIITFDADGSRTFTTGDVQITIVGNVITGGISGGNFVVGASA